MVVVGIAVGISLGTDAVEDVGLGLDLGLDLGLAVISPLNKPRFISSSLHKQYAFQCES